MEKGYVRGILGALLGGIIATIPWVLLYVYGNMIFSFLAVIVALGALKGYQLFKGKESDKLHIIITVVSLVSITIATFIIIPCLMFIQESIPLTLTNLQIIYSDGEFMSAMFKDYVISVVFTFLGISGVIKSIKNKEN